jgi:hypothetical protein
MGARIGSSLGGALGHLGQAAISKVFSGFGEYREEEIRHHGISNSAEALATSDATPEVNTLVGKLSTASIPMMHRTDSEGAVRVTRREFVNILTIGSTAQTALWRINPGRSFTHPWLARVANGWQRYRYMGFSVVFIPTSGLAVSSTNASLGQISMAFVYNINAVASGGTGWPLTSLQGMLNMNGAVSCSPAASAVCFMECASHEDTNQTRFIINEEAVQPEYANTDYDTAYLMVRTEGGQAAMPYQAGQLWITYDIMLYQPRTINPALAIRVPAFQQALDEFHALMSHKHMCTDREWVAIESRLRELRCLFRSMDYQLALSKAIRENQNGVLVDEKLPVRLDPVVAELFERCAQEEKEGVPTGIALRANIAPGPPEEIPSPPTLNYVGGKWVAVEDTPVPGYQ